jgi:hypothetical protein
MSIFEYFEEQKSVKDFKEVQDKAQKIFDVQKKAIRDIKDTEGFKAMREYWVLERDGAIQRMSTSKGDDEVAKAMFILADRYLKFLESRLKG